jgi:hypothetical protein
LLYTVRQCEYYFEQYMFNTKYIESAAISFTFHQIVTCIMHMYVYIRQIHCKSYGFINIYIACRAVASMPAIVVGLMWFKIAVNSNVR